jgi:hypothetical protein
MNIMNNELIFNYDIMHVFEDRYEFKRFKKKPIFKILSDIFVSRAGFVFLITILVLALMHLVTYLAVYLLMSASSVLFIISNTSGVFCFIMFDKIITYYVQHKNISIPVSDVKKLYLSKNKKTLNIEYKRGKKVVDMPDIDNESQDVIAQLNKMQLIKL